MIRWAVDTDRRAIIGLMQLAKMGCSWYDYSNFDGLTLVDIQNNKIVGYVRFDLGRPETYIRQIVVHPDFQNTGLIVKRLLLTVMKLAITHGAQGIEGFQPLDKPWLTEMTNRLGAINQDGVRVRWPLSPKANEKAEKWLAQIS